VVSATWKRNLSSRVFCRAIRKHRNFNMQKTWNANIKIKEGPYE